MPWLRHARTHIPARTAKLRESASRAQAFVQGPGQEFVRLDPAVRRTSVAPAAQPAKTTLFAGGNEADVRKTAAGRFSN
jgi:hypothetical protein